MATVVNFIDTTLQSASTRTTNTANAAVQLLASTNVFHINAAGANDPASISFTYSLIDLDGPATFAATGGTLTTSGNVATLTYANMPGSTAIVTASVTVNGVTFTSNPCFVTKVLDGAPGTGTPGARGAGHYYATGTWTDAAADAATPGANIIDDVVTISNSTLVSEKKWTGSAWVDNGLVINGNLIVDGSVLAAKINANSLIIRDAAGNPIVGVGVPLGAGYEAPGTKNSDVTLPTLGQNNYRVVAVGASSTTHPTTAGLYLNGTLLQAGTRSYMLTIISRTTGLVGYSNYYDIFSGSGAAATHGIADMIADLNSVGSSAIAVVWTYDEPQSHRLDSTLATALYRCGASRTVFGSSVVKYRSAYVLVGIGGCGEGNGIEAYQGVVDSDINGWCDVAFSVTNGALLGFSGNAAGKANSDAINDSTTGLAARLRNNAANVLSGGAGLVAGSLTYDTSGNRTGGFGVAFNQRGIVGFNSSGVATITMNVSTGAIAVAGDISGSTGTFGAVTVGVSLNCGQSAYNTGTGFWMGLVSGTPKFSIGVAGGAGMTWDGTALTIKDAVTVRTTPFAVSNITNVALSFAKGTSERPLGTYTASSAGGTGTINYVWSLDQGTANGQGMTARFGSSPTGTTMSVYGKCNVIANCDLYITVTATDGSGVSAVPETFNINTDWT
jgi:hypothetical protein